MIQNKIYLNRSEYLIRKKCNNLFVVETSRSREVQSTCHIEIAYLGTRSMAAGDI